MKSAALLAVCTGLASDTLGAQEGTGGTIRQGEAVFAVGDYPSERSGTGPQSVLSLSGPAGINHVQMSHWWYRLNNRLRESALSGATAQWYDGGTSGATFALASGVAAVLENALVRSGSGGVRLTQRLTVTNNTATPFDVTLFSFAHFTLGGGRGSVVSIDSPRMMRMEADGWTATYAGLEAQAYEADGAERMLSLLTDHDRFDLASLPAGGHPAWIADTAGAFGWSFVLGPGESRAVTTEIRLIPGPGACGVLLAGAIVARRRRTVGPWFTR